MPAHFYISLNCFLDLLTVALAQAVNDADVLVSFGIARWSLIIQLSHSWATLYP